MITTFLVAHSWAVPFAFLLVVGRLLLGAILLRAGERGRRVTVGLAAAAGLAALGLTLVPSGTRSEVGCTVQFA